MAQFKYLATIVTNQNFMHKEIKRADYIHRTIATIRSRINHTEITNKMQLFTRIYYSTVY